MKLQHPKDPLMETIIRSAKLHIYKRGGKMDASNESSSLDSLMEVNVYHVTADSNTSETKRTLVDTKIIDFRESGWVIFNIQQALQNWLDGPTKKDGLLRLQLSSKACTKDLHRIFQVNRLMKRSLRDQEPRLNVKTSERLILGRVKRDIHTGDCEKGDGETQCCRFSLKIDFKELSWDDWVIAPTSFNAYYCEGDCGSSRLANDWALVKNLIHQANPEKMPVGVCCVPNEYKGLTLLHYNNDGQLTLSEKQNMVVQDCRCR
ncbi:bone morphogenetic protein 5-like [Octopus sinensis]|nr:bone morphogenetic protein 5-like [Octopus sinensis]XP_036354389.1 bone morphogenetic protein 5-like [Octopus sinensis]